MATGRIGTTPALGFRWSIEPAGGTTSLSGLDNNSVGLSYTPGNERVYRNGVLLSRVNDYTATSGNSITLNDATVAGDIIEVFSQDLTQLADTIARSTLTAKGQVLTATAASTPAVLAVGANDTVLTADSSTATGLKWATPTTGGMTLLASGAFSGDTTFSAISGDYTHLQLVIEDATHTTPSDIDLRINGNTSNSYFTSSLAGQTAQTLVDAWNGPLSYATTSGDSNTNIIFYNYANSAISKVGLRFDTNIASGQSQTAGRLLNSNITAALTSITLFSSAGGTIAGNYKIYGIK